MENNTEKIKTIASLECPHCKKSIIIGTNLQLPDVSVTSTEEVNKNKEKLAKKIKELAVSSENLKAINDLISDEEQVLFDDDVTEIINNLKNK